MMPVVLLLAAAAATPAPTVIHQSTTGWCSPVIANVTGNVTVNCIGVDPRALNRLNAQLAKKDQQLTAKIAEANEWVDRYHELEAQLKAAGSNRELSRQAEEYVHQGDFEKAKEILDRLLKEDANEVDRIAGDYYQRGLISQLQFKPLEALPDFERAYRLNPDKLMFADKYASGLLEEHEYDKAGSVLDAAIRQGREGMAKDPAKYGDIFAWLVYARAGLMADTSRFKQAEADYAEAAAQFRTLAKENPAYQFHVSVVLIDSGNLYETMNRLDAAETAFNEALAIQRSLPESERTQIFISETEVNLSRVYMLTGRRDEAIALLQQAVGILRQLVKSKPAAYERDLAVALNNLGAFCQALGRLPEAEQAAKEAVEILDRAAAANPGAHRPMQAKALTTLANIYSGEHRRDEAEATFQKALVIVRNLARESPEGYQGQLATILYEMALNQSAMGRSADAVKAYEESLNIRRKLAAANFDVYGKAQADSAAALGRLYMDQNNDSAAEPLLREATDAYRRVSVAKPGAFDGETARIFQELALLYFKAKDFARARQAAEESLAIFSRLRSANAEFNHESMARCLLMYAGLTERENFSRACAMVGDAAQLATDAATRQASQTGYASCSHNPAFRRTR